MSPAMSRCTTDYGIIAALVAVEELVGRQADWRAVHDRQASFLDRVFTGGRDEYGRVSEIEALASQIDGLVFPMVDASTTDDLSWLVGMSTSNAQGTVLEVTQARQSSTLRMNETGFRARAATSIEYTLGRTRRRRPHVIDRPFLLWIERPGLSQPLFVAWLDQACWKRPADLGTPSRPPRSSDEFASTK